MARLEIDAIRLSLGGRDVLEGVSLNIAEGECVSILGPSGCGKTTTLRAIAGFAEPYAGDIRIDGKSVLGRPPHKRNLGLVFQDYALFPHMTVGENIAYGLQMRRLSKTETKRRVGDILELVQLSHMESRLPEEMSGGQRQRVALARALVIHPDVLLLDEPLGALDRKLRDQMQVEFRRIQREVGITTIFVTHDQEEALSLSDRVAVMLEGQIREIGAPETLYQRPVIHDVMTFLGSSNIFEGVGKQSTDQKLLVQCDGGLELVVAAQAAVDSGPVRLGIRPENFVIVEAAQTSEENSCEGTIEECIYKGAYADVYVRLDSGQLINIHYSDQQHADVETNNSVSTGGSIVIGSRIKLYVRPENILMFA
jgi:putative spermidine/putrescine transport system ATP-binding protein